MVDSREKKPYIWVNEFTELAVRDFYSDFFELEMESSLPMITVFIDSYGGSLDGMFAMRDLIKGSAKPVSTICIGKAMSAGACLLASGTKGLRFMSKDAEIMVHEASTGMMGKNEDLQSSTRQIGKLNKKMLRNLAEDMGKTVGEVNSQIHKIKNVDWYLNASEAKKWGIVDNIEIPRIVYAESAAMLMTVGKGNK